MTIYPILKLKDFDDIMKDNILQKILMGQKLPENDKELYQRIDEILHYLWDPIGIAGEPFARDEYYAYLPEIFSLAKKKNSEEEIAECLNDIQVYRMGDKDNLDKCKKIARIIVAWSEKLECQRESK